MSTRITGKIGKVLPVWKPPNAVMKNLKTIALRTFECQANRKKFHALEGFGLSRLFLRQLLMERAIRPGK